MSTTTSTSAATLTSPTAPIGPAPTERLGGHRHPEAAPIPADTRISLHAAQTLDGASVKGTLFHPPGATTCVTIVHPRLDMSHHPIIGLLLRAGVAVWSQGMRAVGTDLTLVHEQALLDLAAGYAIARERYERLVALGHSGGGTLNAFYLWQATAAPADRIARTPAGRPTRLAEAVLPVPDAVAFLAAHPGQGEVMLHGIDPSVTDEGDPLAADPELDMYDPENGFCEPPGVTAYTEDFLARYRQAQRERIERIDARARELVQRREQARERFAASGDLADRRASIAPDLLTVYRTEADPRYVDLSLDPNERPYGSLHGARPNLINYGLVGFGRICTPDAWLSTWSGPATNASFAKAAPHVTIPTLYLQFSGDQTLLPAGADHLYGLLGAADKQRATLPGLHFGAPLAPGGRPGIAAAADHVLEWLSQQGC
ncbi:MAG TPA: hypothetical protein VGX23_05585 [Actinocrinis sp.]|nr:hypothetical protein [Actinocrinis sp.]